MSARTTRRRRRLMGLAVGLVGALLVPSLAAAHPLGNFTINHYAGIRIEPDRVRLDVVIDQAEIPTFQARLAFDTDGDGDVSETEADAGRVTACARLAPSLDLAVGGERRVPTLVRAGLAFPPGAGGLSTMRVVCGFEVRLAGPIVAGTTVSYADTSFPDRIGWREIVVEGSGVTIAAAGTHGEPRSAGVSARLTHYPADLLTHALTDTALAIQIMPGGATVPAAEITDASPVPGVGEVATATSSTEDPAVPVTGRVAAPIVGPATTTDAAPASEGSVPGGVTGGDLPSIFRATDLSPIVLLISLLTAVALGAGHALTPGHGKTLMAAYLVGTKGTPVHAVGLGLSVTVSHTIGILALAALIVGAEGVLSPDLVVRSAPVVAAISILGIGGWMLVGEGRRRWRTRATVADHGHDHDTAQGHDPAQGHSHGGVTHSHLPAAGATITWRSLFILGLAGGLIPSTSALLILLGSIAAGRAGFGLVLVVAFGIGMALVMGGIGLALVLARSRLDGVDEASPFGRVGTFVPLLASVLVFGLGIYLTVQAVAGSPTL